LFKLLTPILELDIIAHLTWLVKLVYENNKNQLSRGEICVANFIPPPLGMA
jgi:hypothetical protein